MTVKARSRTRRSAVRLAGAATQAGKSASAAKAARAAASSPSEELAQQLESRIRDRTVPVGVIGLGYVGLPLARAFARGGLPVTGFDIDPLKVQMIAERRSYIRQLSLDWIDALEGNASFNATTDFRLLRKMGAVVICVPTPLTRNREPDMSYIEKTAGEIRKYLERGQLIVLESTTYPGTTEEVVRPILEESGLESGVDFFLAFSPEREDPGNPRFGTTTIPKLVGGVDAASGRLAALLYSTAVQKVVPVSDAKVAESAKILENIYRCVNIALVNELKVLFERMGIDIWEVIDAAATKPFGFQPFYPGPGLGGHCIPIDPFYLTWKAREYGMTTRFIELAGEINTQMPLYVLQRLAEELDRRGQTLSGSSGLVIGVAYKPDIDDVRESPSLEILEMLIERGARMAYHDPCVPRLHKMRKHDLGMASVDLSAGEIARHDFVLILTHHSTVDWKFVVEHARLVVDTRNATAKVTSGREKIVRA
jgi:UDP-N-acetyl-D-glucosamine dehydrogenase